MNELVLKGKLVSAETLLDQLFDPQARPSMRWLRTQTKSKAIPYVRIGHLIFFDVEMVRETLAAKNLVRHRVTAGRGSATTTRAQSSTPHPALSPVEAERVAAPRRVEGTR